VRALIATCAQGVAKGAKAKVRVWAAPRGRSSLWASLKIFDRFPATLAYLQGLPMMERFD